MTEAQYLKVCEQVCRNIFNRLEDLELYAEPTLTEYKAFHGEVKRQIDGYRMGLDALMLYLEQNPPQN